MTTNALELTVLNDLEIRTRRVFNAPRRLVFDAHTKPELLKRWLFGPDGWSLETCEIDLRAGGRFRYVMQRSDGRTDGEFQHVTRPEDGPETMGWGGEFLEVVAPERIVHTELFDEDWTDGATTVTTLFRDLPGGKCEVEMTVRYASLKGRDMALATGMTEGMEMGYARVDALIASGEWK
jgi:uncharacterized protein YndB with AHSA1/START domain